MSIRSTLTRLLAVLCVMLLLVPSLAIAATKDSVVLTPSAKTINKGDTLKLTAKVQLGKGDSTKLVWTSSDPSVATVKDGKVTGVNGGVAVISATATKKNGTKVVGKATITVYLPVKELKLSKKSISLDTGDTYDQLKCSFSPAKATVRTVTWKSSDPEIATVDENGVITAVAPGQTTITATSTDKPAKGKPAAASVEVKVTNPAEAITLSSERTSFAAGKTYDLASYCVFDPYDASYRALTWTVSDPEIATVSEDGVLTALKKGVFELTATHTRKDGTELSAHGTYRIINGVESLTLDKAEMVMEQYDVSDPLICTVLPADADYPEYVWRSSDESIASVNENGVVTAHLIGSVTITAVSTEPSTEPLKASVQVKVVQPVLDISLPETKDVTLGTTKTLTATISPANATNKAVKWKTSNKDIATVNAKGVVTGKKAGTVTITVTTTDGSNLSASCKVRVVLPATGVKINQTSATVLAGKTVTLKATVSPANAGNKKVTWKSSNKKVATVDANGVVTGVSKGTCTITATTADGTKKTATCKIQVEPKVPVDCKKIIKQGYFGIYNKVCPQIRNISKTLTIKRVSFTIYTNYGYSSQRSYSCYYDKKSLKPGAKISNWYWDVPSVYYASNVVVKLNSITYSNGKTDYFYDTILGWYN